MEVIPLLYDFILWMAPKLAHYTKIHRFTLGDRIMTVLLDGVPFAVEGAWPRVSPV